MAYLLGVGFVPIRKKGKLPAETIGHDYELEYGTDRIEIHTDGVSKGDKVLLVDDHPVVRAGYARLLSQDEGIEVVAERETMRKTIKWAKLTGIEILEESVESP